MDRVLWVGLGGAVGSMARYLLATWVLVWAPAGFPWGVLAVNVLGSFAMGLATVLSLGAPAASPWPIFVTAGLLGGFTTYSAFNQDTIGFLERGQPGLAAAHVLGTVVACLGAGFLGLLAARALGGP